MLPDIRCWRCICYAMTHKAPMDDGYQPQGIENPSLQGGERGRLFFYEGQLLIQRGDKTYTLQGQSLNTKH